MKRRMILLVVLVMSILFTAAVSAAGGTYAAGYDTEQTMGMLDIENALGAPDGACATSDPATWSQIMLDMGAEVSGPLIIYSESYGNAFSLEVATGLTTTNPDSGGYYIPSMDGSLFKTANSFRYVTLWDGYEKPEGFGIDAVYAGPILTIASISANTKLGTRSNTYTVLVTIKDTLGNPVTKAVVNAQWSTSAGPVSATATTRRGGEAKFTFKGEALGFCVTGVRHASIPYAPDGSVTSCIGMP